MIIACPACSTRYVVPDAAVGVEGRTVRCAKCKHSWFQDGPEITIPAPAPPTPALPVAAAPRPAEDSAPPTASGFTDSEAEAQDHDPPPLSSEPPVPAPPPIYGEDPADAAFDRARSSFDYEPPFRPRRNTGRLLTIAGLVFALLSLGVIGAVGWYGLPDWMPFARPTFGEGQVGLVLEFPPNKQDRRTLPNGTEFFGTSGKVTNVGNARRSVPPILVVLRDSRDRIVYTRVLHPPASQLAPGESVTINEAVTDVPRAAKYAEIGWKPGS